MGAKDLSSELPKPGLCRLGRRPHRRAHRPVPHPPPEASARACWRREEDFEIEPLVEGGVRDFARVARRGSRGGQCRGDRHFDGTADTGEPERMLDDMNLDGIGVEVMHPNRSLFAVLQRRSRAVDRARACRQRLRRRAIHALLRAHRASTARSRSPTSVTRSPRSSAVPAAAGFRAILLPAMSPVPYWSP